MKHDTHAKQSHRPIFIGGVAALGILIGTMMVSTSITFAPIPSAQAAESGSGHSGASGGGGGHDSGSMHTDSDHGQGGKGKGGSASGKGGAHPGAASQELEEKVFKGKGHDFSSQESEEDSDRPDYAGGGGKPGTGKPGSAGSKKGDLYGDLYVIKRDDNGEPILDSEGRVQFLDAAGNVIPYNEEGEVSDATKLVTVEFGRLNVGRSPDKVLTKALAEALNTIAMDADGVLQTDAAGRIVVVDGAGTVYTIDSPLENLALYKDALTHISDGSWTLQQAAVFLGSASDKTAPITVDEVIYMNDILGINNGTTGYINLTGFNYDRSSVYADQPVTYLKDNGDGTYSTVTSTVMDAVFSGTNYTDSGADAFAQAADDARAVINFVHEPIH